MILHCIVNKAISTLYRIAYHVDTKNTPVWYEQKRPRTGISRGLGSNPRSYSFTSATVQIREYLFTLPQKMAQKPIRYVTIHFQDRRGAASLRYRNRSEISVLCVNKSPIRYGFRAGARAIRYSVDIVKY